MTEQLKFAPFQSVVDLSFFTKLSEKKLNDLKLSESKLGVYATYGIPIGDNKSPTISISGEGFDQTAIDSTPVSFIAPGSITNLNTIESFKSLDKGQLMQQEGDALSSSIKNKSILQDPSNLVRFHIISYSDLKKYKFYYWFAFPAISISWQLNSQTPIENNNYLRLSEAIESWRKTVDAEQWGFYLLKKVNQEWHVGKLSEYETFFNDADDNETEGGTPLVAIEDPCTVANVVSWPIRNYMALLGSIGFENVSIFCHRDHTHLAAAAASSPASKSFWINVTINTDLSNTTGKEQVKVTGWERNSNDKLMPKMSDLNALLNPQQRADQSVDLNLKLMKWRIAPDLDLDAIKNQSCLLLGAGTLGSYIARGLLGWGVRKITLVDNGKVSFSNPVRQPLYSFKDCLDGGAAKAKRAAEVLKEIYPSVNSEGYELEIPMAGHPLTNESKQRADYDMLVDLINAHDVVFLLMDSRESRWLPTVITTALSKLVINVALGFDSSVVMRHGLTTTTANSGDTTVASPHLGCYFCNDVIAPIDSISNQTLDQMCTVTRPGVAMSASSQAIELFASIMQHPQKGLAPAWSPNEQDKHSEENDVTLSVLPHQLRSFLHSFDTMKIWGPSYTYCSACSPSITSLWRENGWEFVKQCLNEPGYVERVSGLKQVQEEADQFSDMGMSGSDDDF